MTTKQRTWGQFATPADVADLLLGFCLRRPADRVLDPSCGDGALLRRARRWQTWLAPHAADLEPDTIVGFELDPAAAEAAQAPGVLIRRANFFTITPQEYLPFDAVIGNPPYTRAEWIGRLDADAAIQLKLFAPEDEGNLPAAQADDLRASFLPRELAAQLSGRAGLYAYFFLHSAAFLREGGRLGFVVPNGWLDVAYGAGLKRFLLDHFRIVAVIESSVERWFGSAGVNTCVVILERTDDSVARASSRVRFARLRRPLSDLIDHTPDDPNRLSSVEQLVGRLLPPSDRVTENVAVRVLEQESLEPAARWGMQLRAPEIVLRRPTRALAPLKQWANVQRGFTTGANTFFYLDAKRVEQWAIEPRFRRPLLKSLRAVNQLRLPSTQSPELLWISPSAELTATGAGRYLAWGEEQGVHLRPTCAGRRPWYALPDQPDAELVLPKGIWQRHFAPLLQPPRVVDQQIYRVTLADGLSLITAAALLNSAWFALQCELRGRLNLGEGVLWLASYELEDVELPDPRLLTGEQRHRLEDAFARLAERPVEDTAADLGRLDRWSLDELVFDVIGLSTAERTAVREALVECLSGRRLRAADRTD